ncbi:MAG: L,D-transpeptidase family protein [Solirubrobacteraceae bacterium]
MKPRSSSRRSSSRVAVIAAGLLVIAALAAVIVYSHGTGSLLGKNASGATTARKRPLLPSAVLKLPGAEVKNGTEPLVVTLAGKPAGNTARPRIAAVSSGQPPVSGTWTTVGNTEVFKTSASLQPCQSYRLTVPQTTHEESHKELTRRRLAMLKVACPSTYGLQLALARLGYLPVSFRPAEGATISRAASRRAAAHLVYDPPKGQLESDISGAPPVEAGTFDATTKGALMRFQEQHHMEGTGEPGPETWSKLLVALAHNYRDLEPYTFVTVTESLPETLQVHKGNSVVLTSPTNTGVPGAETEKGIFPIFERLTFQIMRGTDTNGYKYAVPVHWINYFNGGDAVHSYERASYGFPQSNGCVELPISTGEKVFPMLALGDIVWVT